MLNALTEHLTTFITSLYVTTGLAGIVLAMAIESCCIPLPSEVVMPLAGGMIASGNRLLGTNPAWPLWLNLVLIALAGSIGCLIGSIAAYGIGYAGGRPLMLKYGRYVLISQHDADKADAFFQRWGSATAFFSRLLPVVRTYISLPAGISRMPFARFCIYTFLGSFPWCLVLGYVGYVLGKNSTTLGPIFHSLDVVVVVAVVILVALYIWRHIRNDNRARAEHARAGQNLAQASGETAAAEARREGMTQQNPWGQQPSSMPQNWNQPPQQGWNQPPAQPPQQPMQQGWNQPQPPSQPMQQGWGASQPQQPPQQGWGQPNYPPQPPQQWNQPQPAQPQQWGRVQSPPPQQGNSNGNGKNMQH